MVCTNSKMLSFGHEYWVCMTVLIEIINIGR